MINIQQTDLTPYFSSTSKNRTGKKNNFAAALAAKQQQNTNVASVGAKSGIDYDYLAAKYDPENMTQEKYDEFLDYLQDVGEITQHEKEGIGYHGFLRVTPVTTASIPGTSYNVSVCHAWAYPDGVSPLLIGDEIGNNLKQWTKVMASRKIIYVCDVNGQPLEGSDTAAAVMNQELKLFEKLSSIFDKIKR